MEGKDALERYAELRRIVEEAEAEIDKLKPVVVEALQGGEGTYAGEGFKLSLRKSKTWEYTEVVSGLQEKYNAAKKEADGLLAEPKKELADAKKNEEKTGLATLVSETASPMYKKA